MQLIDNLWEYGEEDHSGESYDIIDGVVVIHCSGFYTVSELEDKLKKLKEAEFFMSC